MNTNFLFTPIFAIMALFFISCSDDEDTTTQANQNPEAQLSGTIDSIMYIADISNAGNFNYYLTQSDLNHFIHLITDEDNVSNAEVTYVTDGGYYALSYNYTFVQNGITYDASALSPLEDDGIHAYVNVQEIRFFFGCKGTWECNECAVVGRAWSDVAEWDCKCGYEILPVDDTKCQREIHYKTIYPGENAWTWYLSNTSYSYE